MSLAIISNNVTQIGDGVTVAYNFYFPFDNVSEIYCRQSTADRLTTVTILNIGTDYVVSAPGNSGVVTFTIAPPVGYLVDIVRWVQPVQNTTLQNLGVFPSMPIEDSLDYLTEQVQQIINAPFIGQAVPTNPWTYIGLQPNTVNIPNLYITPAMLNLTGNTPIVTNVPFQVTRLTYGQGTTAVADSTTANAINVADYNRGTGTNHTAQVNNFTDLAYASRDHEGAYFEDNACARFMGSGSGIPGGSGPQTPVGGANTFTASTVTATDWYIGNPGAGAAGNTSQIQPGMAIDVWDITASLKFTGVVASVNGNTVTIVTGSGIGWGQVGAAQGTTGTPNNASLVIVNPMTKIWGQNTNIIWGTYSDPYVANGTGHEIGIINNLDANRTIWGLDVVNLQQLDGTAAPTAVAGSYPGATAYIARGGFGIHYTSAGATDYAFWAYLQNSNTVSPQVVFNDNTNSQWTLSATVGTHSGGYLQFIPPAAPPWSASIAYAIGMVAAVGGTNYIAIAASTNHTPPNATYWAVDNTTAATAWSSVTAYTPGNQVSVAGQNYTCIANTTNNTPPNLTYWIPYTGIFGVSTLMSDGVFTGTGLIARSLAGQSFVYFANGPASTSPNYYDWAWFENTRGNLQLVADNNNTVALSVLDSAAGSGYGGPYYIGVNKATPVAALDVVGAIAATGAISGASVTGTVMLLPTIATGTTPVAAATAGSTVFDTSNHKLWVADGSTWKSTTLA